MSSIGYWFSHLPNNPGCGPGEVANNWWLYFANPTSAIDPSSYCEVKDPVLEINFDSGQPASYFTIKGSYFPPDSEARITINGSLITATVSTDSFGGIEIVLDTRDADNGHYQVTITVNPSANIDFTLDPSEPLRPKDSNAIIVPVPGGLGQKAVMLPFITSPTE